MSKKTDLFLPRVIHTDNPTAPTMRVVMVKQRDYTAGRRNYREYSLVIEVKYIDALGEHTWSEVSTNNGTFQNSILTDALITRFIDELKKEK